MDQGPTQRHHFTISVLTMVGALIVVAIGLVRLASNPAPVLPLHLPVWAAFVGLLAAGMAPLMLEVQANTFSISLTEVPIALCLLGMPRVPMLVAATGGWMCALLFGRRRAPLKFAFNSALIVFEMAIVAATFDTLESAPALTSSRTWVALIAGTVLASIASGLAVNVVIALAGDVLTFRQAFRHSMLTIANATVATTLTLLAAMCLDANLVAGVPLVFLGAVSIVPLRRNARLQRRYDGLLLLHEFTAGLTGSTDLSTTLENVLAETAKVLRVADAAIVLPREGDAYRRSYRPELPALPIVGDAVWERIIVAGTPVCLERGSTEAGRYLEMHGLHDLMGVPLVHGEQVVGALIVCNRIGEVSTFDHDDLSIFGTMANQTTVTLENLRLIDRLRDESAEREHQALHDELTGLPNRAHFSATLEQRLTEGPVAVAMVDLNRFKEVNDTLGHHAGDEVLIQTSQRLRRALPASAHLARLGGDEFAIVLPHTSRASDALGTLAHVELALAEPIVLDAMTLRIDASIGVAISPGHGNDRGTLLRHADVAMYAAKQVRGTTVRVYDRAQERSSKRSLELVGALRDAIENETIDVAFQPKARLATGVIVGAEALARWSHPVFGVVPPDEFIPLAEQAGLIDALTTVILRRSLAACSQWHADGHGVGVAVNVDAQTLLGESFASKVLAAIADAQLEPHALTIEITERDLVRELDAATTIIELLRAEGINFSIDDFGTGYSSLAYLSRLPVDEVKIDRTFVAGVTASPVQQSIVRAISDIADKIGASTVVEGVEDAATWDAVAGLGCSDAQGYFLARPMPEASFLRWLDQRSAPTPAGLDRWT